MGIEAGRLRHRIRVDQRVSTKSTTGAEIVTWVPIIENLPAEVAPISGREFLAGNQILASVTTRITIRYRDLDSRMRIVFRAKIYNIEQLLPDNESGVEWLTIMCSAGTNQG